MDRTGIGVLDYAVLLGTTTITLEDAASAMDGSILECLSRHADHSCALEDQRLFPLGWILRVSPCVRVRGRAISDWAPGPGWSVVASGLLAALLTNHVVCSMFAPGVLELPRPLRLPATPHHLARGGPSRPRRDRCDSKRQPTKFARHLVYAHFLAGFLPEPSSPCRIGTQPSSGGVVPRLPVRAVGTSSAHAARATFHASPDPSQPGS